MRTATRTTDYRRLAMAGAAECAHANASDTTTPPQQPTGAAARYTMARSTTPEDTSVSKRRTHAAIRSTGPTHDGEEAPLQPAASTRSSRERPPHLTSAASAPRHATKIDTPADDKTDEGERRVTSVRPLASNTARATVLRGAMRARRHNTGRESVSARNPKSGALRQASERRWGDEERGV